MLDRYGRRKRQITNFVHSTNFSRYTTWSCAAMSTASFPLHIKSWILCNERIYQFCTYVIRRDQTCARQYPLTVESAFDRNRHPASRLFPYRCSAHDTCLIPVSSSNTIILFIGIGAYLSIFQANHGHGVSESCWDGCGGGLAMRCPLAAPLQRTALLCIQLKL